MILTKPSPPSDTVNLPTCAPPTSLRSAAGLSRTLAFLDVGENKNLRELQSLLYTLDPDYSCGLLLDPEAEKAVLVYAVTAKSSGSVALGDKLRALDEASVTVAVLVRPDSEILPGSSYITRGSAPTIVLEPLSDQVRHFSLLAGSKKAVVLGSRVPNATRSDRSDLYNCSDFTSRAAAQAFFQSTPGDPNRLDADNDGRACEVYDSFTYTAAPVARPEAPAKRPSTSSATPSRSSGMCALARTQARISNLAALSRHLPPNGRLDSP